MSQAVEELKSLCLEEPLCIPVRNGAHSSSSHICSNMIPMPLEAAGAFQPDYEDAIIPAISSVWIEAKHTATGGVARKQMVMWWMDECFTA